VIFDVRIYTTVPGKLNAWLKLYEEHAYPTQQKYLGKPVLFATTEVGPLNQVIHIWGFASQADREERRTKMDADPAWAKYRQMSAEAGYLLAQEDRICKSASFSPL
jgi:hypothetical protein